MTKRYESATVSTVNGVEIKMDVSNFKYYIKTDGKNVKYWKSLAAAEKWAENNWMKI